MKNHPCPPHPCPLILLILVQSAPPVPVPYKQTEKTHYKQAIPFHFLSYLRAKTEEFFSILFKIYFSHPVQDGHPYTDTVLFYDEESLILIF